MHPDVPRITGDAVGHLAGKGQANPPGIGTRSGQKAIIVALPKPKPSPPSVKGDPGDHKTIDDLRHHWANGRGPGLPDPESAFPEFGLQVFHLRKEEGSSRLRRNHGDRDPPASAQGLLDEGTRSNLPGESDIGGKPTLFPSGLKPPKPSNNASAVTLDERERKALTPRQKAPAKLCLLRRKLPPRARCQR